MRQPGQAAACYMSGVGGWVGAAGHRTWGLGAGLWQASCQNGAPTTSGTARLRGAHRGCKRSGGGDAAAAAVMLLAAIVVAVAAAVAAVILGAVVILVAAVMLVGLHMQPCPRTRSTSATTARMRRSGDVVVRHAARWRCFGRGCKRSWRMRVGFIS